MYEALALLAVFATIYSAVAGGVERTWVSGPIVFVAVGLLIGPSGFDVLRMEPDAGFLRTLAELTLALVLFTDAASANLRVLEATAALPIRLLTLGLPLTILLGFGFGSWLMPDLDIFELALLATMLAPTDAALGKGVITNEVVPVTVRQGLNVESGLNDGICVPVLFMFLALARGEAGEGGPLNQGLGGLGLFGKQLGIGLAVGLMLAGAAVGLMRLAKREQWMAPTWIKVTVIGLALSCFATSQAFGGSGFIASFVGGLLFGGMMKPHHGELLDAAEGIGDSFALLTWVIFGAAFVGQALGEIVWAGVLYAVLSLTIVRMAPVFLVTAGLGQSTEGRLFMGWFGPRGLASIVFGVIVADAVLPHGNVITATVTYTVLLSIVAHGISANPWARAYGARVRQASR